MKKLLFLSIIALFTVASANVFGQAGQGAAPVIGSTHQYWINGTMETPTSGATSTYTWWISTDAANLLTPVTSLTDFTPTAGYNTGAVGQNGIELKWNPSSAGNTYYLVVREAGVAPLCTNIKAYAIQPTNSFQLKFAMLDGTTLVDVLDNCAPDIAMTATGTTISYNYGSGSYVYKLSATGLYSAWSLDYAFTNALGGSADTYEYSINGGTSYTSVASTEAALTIPASATGSQDVLIRVKLVNGTNEGLAAQTMKLTLANVKDAGGNVVTKITNNANADITSLPIQTQTVKARPATSGISSN